MASSLTLEIAAEIRAEMARQRVSQEALAKRVSWDQRTVSRRLTGEVSISADEIEAIAAALGVEVSRFLPASAA